MSELNILRMDNWLNYMPKTRVGNSFFRIYFIHTITPPKRLESIVSKKSFHLLLILHWFDFCSLVNQSNKPYSVSSGCSHIFQYFSVSCSIYWKQSPQVFCKKDVLKSFAKFARKNLCQSLFFNDVKGLGPSILLKKRLRRRCFPVNFAKFLRALFYRTRPVAACDLLHSIGKCWNN